MADEPQTADSPTITGADKTAGGVRRTKFQLETVYFCAAVVCSVTLAFFASECGADDHITITWLSVVAALLYGIMVVTKLQWLQHKEDTLFVDAAKLCCQTNTQNKKTINMKSLPVVFVSEIVNLGAHMLDAACIIYVFSGTGCSPNNSATDASNKLVDMHDNTPRSANVIIVSVLMKLFATVNLYMLQERQRPRGAGGNTDDPTAARFTRTATSIVACALCAVGSGLAVSDYQAIVYPTEGDYDFAEASVTLTIGILLMSFLTFIANVQKVNQRCGYASTHTFAVGVSAGIGSMLTLHGVYQMFSVGLTYQNNDRADIQPDDVQLILIIAGLYVFLCAPFGLILNDW